MTIISTRISSLSFISRKPNNGKKKYLQKWTTAHPFIKQSPPASYHQLLKSLFAAIWVRKVLSAKDSFSGRKWNHLCWFSHHCSYQIDWTAHAPTNSQWHVRLDQVRDDTQKNISQTIHVAFLLPHLHPYLELHV